MTEYPQERSHPLPHSTPEAVLDDRWDELANQDSSGKTLSRRLVENFLIHFRWYNPHAGKSGDNVPDLKKAWAYYEHVTLARYRVKTNQAYTFDRADPGETNDTELYPIIKTPMKVLNDWGIAVGLYFTELRAMAIILFIAGLISLRNILFFQSNDYNGGIQVKKYSYLMFGSAACYRPDLNTTEWDLNATEWSVCENNYCNHTLMTNKKYTFINGTSDAGEAATLVQRSCDGGNLTTGMYNYAAVFFLIFASIVLNYYQSKREVMLDEDKLTATDYSIVVKNPPPDATDPEEWRDFFGRFGDNDPVTVCTICLDNAALVRALIIRRILINRIKNILPNTDVEDDVKLEQDLSQYILERGPDKPTFFGIIFRFTLLPIFQLLGLFLPLETLIHRLEEKTNEIKELQKKDYKVKRVFITFETEEAQRTALEALQVGKIDVWLQRVSSLPSQTLFKGKLLSVSETEEPTSVRWLDLEVRPLTSLLQSSFTLILTFGMVAASGCAIYFTRKKVGTFLAGIITSTLNFLFPFVVKRLMIAIEQHKNESTWQASLYLRITLFRWTNTAIMARFLTAFRNTLGIQKTDLLPTVSGILLSELWLTPLLRYLDLWGFLQKHVLGPRATTQRQMNLYFKGTYYFLAERYTDFTKVVFLCYMYCALNPLSFFICSGILVIQFFVDKFCLLRMWSPAPLLGTKLTVYSRRYFYLALVVCVIVCSYDWSLFRFDNICLSKDEPSSSVSELVSYSTTNYGKIEVTRGKVRVCNESECCDQNVRNFKNFFPLVPGVQPNDFSWMSPSQETLSKVYGWSSVAVLSLFLIYVFGYPCVRFILSFVGGTATPRRQDQMVDFSCLGEMAYVPQITRFQFDFPLIACDVDGLDADFIGWNPSLETSHDDYNLIFDVPFDGLMRKRNQRGDHAISTTKKPIFSIVKHWPIPQLE